MTHNETTHIDGADAGRPVVDDPTPTRALGQLPLQGEAPPPPLKPLRRRKLPIATIALAVAAAAGIGFYSGVRVEKGQLKTTGNSGSAAAALGFAGFGNARAGSRTTGGTTPNGAANPTSGTAGRAGAGTGGAGAGGAGGNSGAGGSGATAADGGAANLIGTVAVVDGTTLYITETNGDTVKVTTSDGTTVTKTATGAVKDLAPGESVVIRGVQSSQGVYAAQTVTQGSSAGAAGFGGGGFGGGGFGGARENRSGAGATTAPTGG